MNNEFATARKETIAILLLDLARCYLSVPSDLKMEAVRSCETSINFYG
jgi:hypothetical protein